MAGGDQSMRFEVPLRCRAVNQVGDSGHIYSVLRQSATASRQLALGQDRRGEI